jgi:hypothetical protein
MFERFTTSKEQVGVLNLIFATDFIHAQRLLPQCMSTTYLSVATAIANSYHSFNH